MKKRSRTPWSNVNRLLCAAALGLSLGTTSCLEDQVASIQNAIDQLSQDATTWRVTLENLEQDLVKQGQSTLANEVRDLINGSIASAAQGTFCSVDFIGQRAKGVLEDLIADLTNQPHKPRVPAICLVVPDPIDTGLIAEGRQNLVKFTGYDLDTSQGLTMGAQDAAGEQPIGAQFLSNPSRYEVGLNVSAGNGFQFSSTIQKVILRFNGSEISDVAVVTPKPLPPPETINNLSVTFHTNDEDKDGDTGVSVRIGQVASWEQTVNEHYDDNSTVTKPFSPSSLPLSSIANNFLTICISPNGDDTWRFNLAVRGDRSAGGTYTFNADSIQLSESSRCRQWTLPMLAGCTGGNTPCDNICTNLASDSNNCGACGIRCASGAPCENGVCAAPPPPPPPICPSGTRDCGDGFCIKLTMECP